MDKPQSLPSQDNKIAPNVMAVMETQTLCPVDSLKKVAAKKVVATISKLSKREAVDAWVTCRLNNKMIGAITPPAKIAPVNQGRSFLLMGASIGG